MRLHADIVVLVRSQNFGAFSTLLMDLDQSITRLAQTTWAKEGREVGFRVHDVATGGAATAAMAPLQVSRHWPTLAGSSDRSQGRCAATHLDFQVRPREG